MAWTIFAFLNRLKNNEEFTPHVVRVMSIARELIQQLFDGPVPLLTKRALYLLLYVMALFCSLYPITPLLGLLELIGLSFLVAAIGFAIQYLFFKFQHSSFAHLEQENISDGVFDIATDETAPNPYCGIWIFPGKEPFTISISNIAFRAILISNPLAKKMRANAERTKIVLSKKMLDVKYTKARVHAFLGVVFFVGIWVLHALWLFPYISYLAGWPFNFFGPQLMIFAVYPFCALILNWMLRGLSWKRDRSMVDTYRTYGVLPQIAYIELLQEGSIPDERKLDFLRTYRKQEERARSDRRLATFILLFVLAGPIASVPIIIFGLAYGSILFQQSILFTFCFLFLIAICLSDRHDSRAVSEFWGPLIDGLDPVWTL
jgi:hypothetical protein